MEFVITFEYSARHPSVGLQNIKEEACNQIFNSGFPFSVLFSLLLELSVLLSLHLELSVILSLHFVLEVKLIVGVC